MCLFNLHKKSSIVKQLDYNRPFVVLNFKTYRESTNSDALKLAKIAEKIQEQSKVNMIICCQATDFKELSSNIKIPVYAQHVDNAKMGKSTGAIISEHLLSYNVHGSLVNHSEKRIDIKDIEQIVIKLKELDMKSIVCTKNAAETKRMAAFKIIKPDFIAVEPPELIGSETSVSTAEPEVITKCVKETKGIPLLVGAGVKNNTDIKTALQHGAKGVLLSSHFVLSHDPEKFLKELLDGI